MIHKPENFINRLWWQVYFYVNRDNEKSKDDINFKSFGFASQHQAPSCQDLKPFECDPYDLVRKIEFENEYETRKHNNFQQKLSKDITKINSTDGIVVIADKTTTLMK